MGDLQVFSQQPNGVLKEDRSFSVSFSSPLPASNPDPSSIGEESWAIAEQITQQVICCIHPTLDSEEKRKDVIEYVQRLIRCSLGFEVFPYGSVPLKTYLPDGDIDLTALSSPTVEETLARDVLAVLQGEEQNGNAEYEVKDTQFIDAEVKLVKCLVQNIVIDISFNQLGGLCTLCFLEQVDRLVGKDHLFKRSIILIKAWCYYESRILGAPHGLISTYALETLVLYIFHLFHASLDGPLAVLYRFLDYFSKFDWENYCISLKGPVSKASLPDIVVEMPANVGDDLMLSEEFLRNCMDMFSVPSRGLETNLRAFPQKHLNIIDPLKENNNLGRSVHRGNFYRIRSAFKYGARKLGRILLLPRERTADEIKWFFSNTLERHGRKSGNLSLSSHSRTFSEEKIQLNSLNLDLDSNIPEVEDNELDRYSMKNDSLQAACPTDGIGVLGSHLAGDSSLRIACDLSDCSPSNCDLNNSLSGLYYYAPHNKMLYEEKAANIADERMGFDSWIEHREKHLGAGNGVCSCTNNHEGVSCCGSGILSPYALLSEGLALDLRERDLADIAGSTETLNPLSDLSGDYDSHIRSLLYGQCCHGYALSAPVLPNPNPPTFHSQVQNKKPWETVRRSMPLKRSVNSQMNTTGAVLGSTQNPMNNPPLSNSLGSEEKHKARGTGTYFPNSNGCSCRGKSSQGRGRNQASGNQRQSWRHTRNNGSAPTLLEKKKSFEGGSHELPHSRSQQSTHSELDDDSNSSGFSILSQKLEFGSFGEMPEESGQTASDTCRGWGSTPSPVTMKVHGAKTVLDNNQERVAKQSYHLKDEDFPPLAI
ncbi:hypothetical protein LOK49_LG15G01118 [Camellia lanceoleosa]|uniref:Uncharacterized protein n=1 Tax=Camellia lanceoleosa TaxID=1840588 RepID=A0ACC0F6Q2_9ERIC|nr:hypothetical protein LOK49_LG15G01118 [Camellia lanceoleosa]